MFSSSLYYVHQDTSSYSSSTGHEACSTGVIMENIICTTADVDPKTKIAPSVLRLQDLMNSSSYLGMSGCIRATFHCIILLYFDWL